MAGSMAKPVPECEYRLVTPRGKLNICRAGVYGGQVTDGMCRICAKRGDKPTAMILMPRVAVGDLVERMLTGIGISKTRVQQWLRVKDCGCAKRQKWLNQWGYKQQDKFERVLNRAARWYGIG
jgi:hypothetical protein